MFDAGLTQTYSKLHMKLLYSTHLPDSDDVSHFVQDDTFEDATRFHASDIGDVKLHGSFQTDTSAVGPDFIGTGRS